MPHNIILNKDPTCNRKTAQIWKNRKRLLSLQAIKREKDKAKALGTYQQSPLERAKELLCKHENPSIDVLGADQDLMAALTADDLGKLGRYIVNMNYREKIEKEKQIIREKVEQTIIDKGRGFVV